MARKVFRRRRGRRRMRRHTLQGTMAGIKDGSGGPIATLAKGNGFWSKVARTAITAVKAAGEIKRYALGEVTYSNIVSNPINDFVGPDYVVNSWYCRTLNAGLAQGDSQDNRQGNKIHVKGVKLNARILNGSASQYTQVRVMIIRMQKNFLLDADPSVTSPLPTGGVNGFPKYREIQVLYDESFMLPPGTLANAGTTRQIYREIKQPTFYEDDSSTEPGKGTIILAWRGSQAASGYSVVFNTELTYHNME